MAAGGLQILRIFYFAVISMTTCDTLNTVPYLRRSKVQHSSLFASFKGSPFLTNFLSPLQVHIVYKFYYCFRGLISEINFLSIYSFLNESLLQ